MRSAKDLRENLDAFHSRVVADPHHRYRSWEHCYSFFQSFDSRRALVAEKRVAALQLGFYLASWGMYRGSSFLLMRTYTAHEGVIERLASTEFEELWRKETGSEDDNTQVAKRILAAVAAVKEAYEPFGKATDTLASKVLLGTFACLPACDRFFIDGFKQSGQQYSRINPHFVKRILQFCIDHRPELRAEQKRLAADKGVHYPLMKLADMYFWQIGYEAAGASAGKGEEPNLPD